QQLKTARGVDVPGLVSEILGAHLEELQEMLPSYTVVLGSERPILSVGGAVELRMEGHELHDGLQSDKYDPPVTLRFLHDVDGIQPPFMVSFRALLRPGSSDADFAGARFELRFVDRMRSLHHDTGTVLRMRPTRADVDFVLFADGTTEGGDLHGV